MKLANVIDNLPNLFYIKGASEEEIKEAEQCLELCFAQDYKEYVKRYGIITYDSHEITGLCNNKRLDVKQVTEYERKNNPNIAPDLYVIEQLDIDGVVVWQASTGEIFQSMPNNALIKICNNLEEYLLCS